jgi:glycosyltransferase involved in cell wall biosynthesis
MSYGLPVLVSDIAANREVGLDERRYFRCGGAGDLAEKLAVLIGQGVGEEEKAWFRKEIGKKYDWGRIGGETVKVYEKVLSVK